MDPFKAFAEASLEMEKPFLYRLGKVLISAAAGLAASALAERAYAKYMAEIVKSLD